MTRTRLLISAFLPIFLVTVAIAQNQQKKPAVAVAGRWDAVITNASKIDVPFVLNIIQDLSSNGNIRAEIVNGSESIPFTSVARQGSDLKMALEQYDGVLSVQFEGESLKGEWVRQTSQGVKHYPVHATRMAIEEPSKPQKCDATLEGEWQFTFEGTSTADRVAPASFKQQNARLNARAQDGRPIKASVEGTIAPVTGDYGLLGGEVNCNDRTFRLSRFDGIHIVLVAGEFQRDGSLKGRLNTQGFTAVRKQELAKTNAGANSEPDPESVTTLKDRDEPFRFAAIDPKTGKQVTQDDPRFKGKPYIVDIFGTWCPNCHDEAPLLADLYKRYRSEGLEIVGLAYEYVDDRPRNARLLEVYRKKYGLEFPLLLAGTTDEGQIAKTLPQLVGFGAYPTTIFVGKDGKVQKIHAGFSGPATGDRFSEVKRRFEENVKELLSN